MSVTPQDIQKCVDVALAFGATRLILFGSALEEPERARDIDLAFEGVEGWQQFEMGARMEEAVHKQIDLVPLRPNDPFCQYVLETGRLLYARRSVAKHSRVAVEED